jgi:hypothetical protein
MMGPASFLRHARRALRKPPREIARRVGIELRHELDRFTVPAMGRRFTAERLRERTGHASVDDLWRALCSTTTWPFRGGRMDRREYDALCPGDAARIIALADAALEHRIELLGSGSIHLGPVIDWHRDFVTGDRWPNGYFRGIDYVNRGRPSDVKRAWELSRLQWLIPAAQAYALTLDDQYAAGAREVLRQWIEGNPFASTVNWGVTMEPAIRIFTFAWLLREFGDSPAWAATGFREQFLCAIYLHAVFTERFIERSDVNGNHFTADAASLVVAGSLFAACADGRRWLAAGMADLEREILVQVHPDGVDFEASCAYHRLVAELFLFAAMAAESSGVTVSQPYRERLRAMARFTASYLRPDGSAPLWGDADDARALPMGPQRITEHGYLVGLIGTYLEDDELRRAASGSRAETAWLCGLERAAGLSETGSAQESAAFRVGGVFILRGDRDHVFVDCGPVGLAGRGGHGHNDLLSFEAHLCGIPLVTDSGCLVYTGDFDARNRFRATAAHNTPQVDGAEINRFTAPDELWNLSPDATPVTTSWQASPTTRTFEGGHDGYARLKDPVRISRRISLDGTAHCLEIVDDFECRGPHVVEVPLHLAPGVRPDPRDAAGVVLTAEGRGFCLSWEGDGWSLSSSVVSIAPSYGCRVSSYRLAWRCEGIPCRLKVVIRPQPAHAEAG